MVKVIVNDYTENTYIINEKAEAVIIDPGTNFIEISKYILENNFHILGILLTHGHFDHLYSLNDLVKKFDCQVFIHEKEKDFLFDPNLNLSSITQKKFVMQSKNNVISFKDNHIIKLGYENINTYPTPGHTKGGVCYHYKNYLFTGDTLFQGSVGRTDLPTSSRSDLEKSIKFLVKKFKDNTVVYPGHGQHTTMLSEKRDNPFIKT